MQYIKKVRVKKPVEEHRTDFFSHVREDADGCWRWTAAKNNIGYGLFRMQGSMKSAHRSMMMLEGHDIVGKMVFHTCDSYDCVNPDHLLIGELKDKVQIMKDKGRAGTFWSNPIHHTKCLYCDYFGSPAPIAHFHNNRCKHKP